MKEHIETFYDPFKVGFKIRRIRQQKSLTLKDLSILTKIPYTRLSYLENGVVKRIKSKDIELICTAFNISTDEILNAATEKVIEDDLNLISELELIESFININKPLFVKDRILRLLSNNYEEHKYKNKLYRILGDYHCAIEQYHIAISNYEKINYSHNHEFHIDHEILRSEICYINALDKSTDTETAVFKYISFLERLEKIDKQEDITKYKVIAHYNLASIYLHMYQFNKAKLIAINGYEYNRLCHVPHVHFDYLLAIIHYFDENWNEAVISIKKSFTKLRYENNKDIVLKSSTLLYYFVMNQPIVYGKIEVQRLAAEKYIS